MMKAYRKSMNRIMAITLIICLIGTGLLTGCNNVAIAPSVDPNAAPSAAISTDSSTEASNDPSNGAIIEQFESATKMSQGCVKVVNLYGTWREMGHQYGQLLKDELHRVYNFTEQIANASKENRATAKAITQVQTDQSSYIIREFMAGASETSQLSHKQLQMANAVERIAGLPACSGIAVWDDYAKDNLVFGRNYDYGENFRLLKDCVAVCVYHPTDGSLATATIGYVGEIYAVNALNEKGIFLELNNGKPSAPNSFDKPCITGTSLLFDMMFQADSLKYTDRFFNTSICSSSYIINMANAKTARSYEWCASGAKQGSKELIKDGLLVSTNHYVNKNWGFPTPTNEGSWDSLTRRDNLINLARENKGEIDTAKMMEIMDTNVEDGGATEDYTVYQLVVEPETLTIWLKITAGNDWTEIHMSDYLKQG